MNPHAPRCLQIKSTTRDFIDQLLLSDCFSLSGVKSKINRLPVPHVTSIKTLNEMFSTVHRSNTEMHVSSSQCVTDVNNSQQMPTQQVLEWRQQTHRFLSLYRCQRLNHRRNSSTQITAYLSMVSHFPGYSPRSLVVR